MVSGTSTGSLLTTAIVLKNNDTLKNGNRPNMYFAENASSVYINYGKDVFKTFESPMWINVVGTIAFTILGGILGYCLGRCIFHNPEYEKTMDSFLTYIKTRKAQRKTEYMSAHSVVHQRNQPEEEEKESTAA
jgi:hypothetical protein